MDSDSPIGVLKLFLQKGNEFRRLLSAPPENSAKDLFLCG